MDIRQLKAFVEVAANGSYARTAAIVGVAQSALSRQISALERGIGGRLFHRTGRGVVLTELGERMLPRARGSAFQILKRTSHVIVELDEYVPRVKKNKRTTPDSPDSSVPI